MIFRAPLPNLRRISGLVRGGIVVLAALLAGCLPASKSRDSHSDADVLAESWVYFRNGEYNKAAAGFDEVMGRTKQGEPEHLQAIYGLACTWSLRRPGEDTARAAGLYQRILDEAPDDPLASWCALALVRQKITADITGKLSHAEVMELYDGIVRRYPGQPAALEALVCRETARLRMPAPEGGPAKVVPILTEFVQDPKNSAWASVGHLILASAYRALNQPRSEMNALIQSMETWDKDPRSPKKDDRTRNYWQIAVLADFQVKDAETAKKYYRKIIEESPQDKRIYYARIALERLEAQGTGPDRERDR